MKPFKSVIICKIAFYVIVNFAYGQNNINFDTISIDYIASYIEEIAAFNEDDIDYSDIYQDYVNLFNNPVNINGSDIDILKDLYLINMNQLINIKQHIRNHGIIFSKYELLDIAGIDQETVNRISPAIVYGEPKTKTGEEIKNNMHWVNHELILRFGRVIEQKVGYENFDSTGLKPGSTYLGDPYNIYLRYGLKAGKKIRFGITLDKDAGEMLPFKKLTDTITTLLQKKKNNTPDFFSLFLSIDKVLFFSNITIGDFHAEFGQGLTMWSGFSFGKSSFGSTLQKYSRAIRPNTSANENRFLRGISASAEFGKLRITSFVSINTVDANSDWANGERVVTSFQESGLHRTINEIHDKKSVRLNIFGGNIIYRSKNLKLGLTGSYSKLNTKFKESDKIYKLFNYNGNKIINTGVDFVFNHSRFSLYGEGAYSSNSGLAFVAGIDAFLNERLTLSLNYHNYGKYYFGFMVNPVSSGSDASGEKGIYLGFNALINSKVSFSGYFDFVKYKWLRYQSIMPDMNTNRYTAQLIYNLSKNSDLSLTYRYKTSLKDLSLDDKYLKSSLIQKKHDLRFAYKHNIGNSVFLTTRLYYSFMKRLQFATENGFLISQNVKISPLKYPLSININFSLFDISDYSTRIYNYENDVLYSFSVPAYNGKGRRWYLLVKYDLIRSISMWFRISRTTYFDRDEIGSGSELIASPSKTEVKFQTIIKL